MHNKRLKLLYSVVFTAVFIIALGSMNTSVVAADSNYRALVIGNWDYGPGSSLNGPPYDIKRMQKVLNNARYGTGMTSFSKINTVENGTKQEMLNAISNTFADATINDVSIFYYSGHGTTDDSGTAGICPVDDSYISVNELEAALDAVAGTKVVILDSCFSGGFIGKYIGSTNIEYIDFTSDFNESVIAAFSKPASRYLNSGQYKVLTAASSTETAADCNYVPGWGYGGEFTNSLVKGCGYYTGEYPADINSDNSITLNEAYNYTKKNVKYSHVQVYPYNDYSFALFGISQVTAVTGITLNTLAMELDTGSTKQLEALITPDNATNKQIYWSSSDERLASVDSNGLVTGVAAGQCVIAAETQDSQYIAKCDVVVLDRTMDSYQQYTFSTSTVNQNVALDRKWYIKFNKELNQSTVNTDNIYIADKYQEKVSCSTACDGKNILLTPLVNYKPNAEYKIYITDRTSAADGSHLKSGVLASFKTCSDNTVIGKPMGVVATAISPNEINIFWNEVPDADYYYIYRSLTPTGTFEPFMESDETRHRFYWYEDYCVRIYGYDPGTTVYYKVTAVRDGIESEFSDVAFATTEEDYSSKCLSIVQNGYFNNYPYEKVKIAFENYFGSPTWEYFYSTDDSHIVEFVGKCRYNGRSVTILMQFVVDIDNETFEVCYTEKDQIALNDREYKSLMDSIFSSYRSIEGYSANEYWNSSELEKIPIYDINNEQPPVLNGDIRITDVKLK